MKRRRMKKGGNGGIQTAGIGDVTVVGRVIFAAVVIVLAISVLVVVAAVAEIVFAAAVVAVLRHLFVAVKFLLRRFGQSGRFGLTHSY